MGTGLYNKSSPFGRTLVHNSLQPILMDVGAMKAAFNNLRVFQKENSPVLETAIDRILAALNQDLPVNRAINRFIAEHNEVEAKPFIWRAEPDVIIASRNRGFQALEVVREQSSRAFRVASRGAVKGRFEPI